jgi:Superfamily II DNA and RNA helicases
MHPTGRQEQDIDITTKTTSAQAEGSFESFGLSPSILRGIAKAGFVQPRPIQARTIPQVLAGRDVLGLAQTGTGKTAAFALPIIERLAASRGRRTRALILAPTRELAMQIHAEIGLLARCTDVWATTVFGGVGAAPQVKALRKGPHIVVACPGRLLDLMGSGDANLDGLQMLVLDEADHMLDMGFLPDIKRILKRLPKRRQNLLFSATMPREIRSLTDGLLHDPHVVELAVKAPLEMIEHALYPVEQKRKAALLHHILSGDDFRSAIVFLRTKHRAKRLARDLDRVGHRAIALQGNMSQGQRQRAMQGFRDGTYDVLVATDIAARGIDVADVSHVVNFDIPGTPDAYTHRIGRTGRSECSGKAYTFVTHEDFPAIKLIERKLDMQIQRIKLRDFGGDFDEALALSRSRDPDTGGRGGSGGRGGAGAGGRGGNGRGGGAGGRGSGSRRKQGSGKLSKGGARRQRVSGACGPVAREPPVRSARFPNGVRRTGSGRR